MSTTESGTMPFHESMPFMRVLGAELVSAGPDEVRASLAWAPERCTSGGVLHGGALMALADQTGGMCAYANLPEGSTGTTTIESKTNFIRAVSSGHVEAVSRPLHLGRTVIVVETELRDAEARLVAKVTQSQLVMRA